LSISAIHLDWIEIPMQQIVKLIFRADEPESGVGCILVGRESV